MAGARVGAGAGAGALRLIGLRSALLGSHPASPAGPGGRAMAHQVEQVVVMGIAVEVSAASRVKKVMRRPAPLPSSSAAERGGAGR